MSNDKGEATYYGPRYGWQTGGPVPSGPVSLPPASGRPGWRADLPPDAEPPQEKASSRLLMPQERANRTVRLAIAVGVLVGIALLGMGVFVQRQDVLPAGVPLIGKDTGVAACEAMAAKHGVIDGDGDKTWSDKDYEQIRGVFADSRYAEIREPGQRFIDLAWQLQGMGKDAGLALLPMIGPMTQAYADLAGGCSEHGATLPPLGR